MQRARILLVALLIVGVSGAGLAAMSRECPPRSAAFSRAADDAARNATAKPEARDAAEEEVEEEGHPGLTLDPAMAAAQPLPTTSVSGLFRQPVARQAEECRRGHGLFIRGPPRDR